MDTTTLVHRGEKELLRGQLEDQRAHVLGVLEGLDDAALRRPVLPSGWSPLGLVQHLTLDVEHFWFEVVVAGLPLRTPDGASAWQVGPEVPASAVLAAYRHATEGADAVIAATPLDAPPRWWPTDLADGWRLHSLREVLLHVLTETACHAGHLDAARELLDGRQWLVLD
jgi:uncharacterized damage-inducible protein DinB